MMELRKLCWKKKKEKNETKLKILNNKFINVVNKSLMQSFSQVLFRRRENCVVD